MPECVLVVSRGGLLKVGQVDPELLQPALICLVPRLLGFDDISALVVQLSEVSSTQGRGLLSLGVAITAAVLVE